MTEIKRFGYYGWDTWVSAKAIQQTMQDSASTIGIKPECASVM